ncbi:MAG: iron-sulfur cluster assembly scaffold protein [Fimbriimonas sp.]
MKKVFGNETNVAYDDDIAVMFGEVAKRHIAAPRGFRPLQKVTHTGHAGVEGDGPFMILSLHVEAGKVTDAGFKTMGCPSSIACGSLVCELCIGRQTDQLANLDAKDLILILGGLPEGKEHCAALAATSLKDALNKLEEY